MNGVSRVDEGGGCGLQAADVNDPRRSAQAPAAKAPSFLHRHPSLFPVFLYVAITHSADHVVFYVPITLLNVKRRRKNAAYEYCGMVIHKYYFFWDVRLHVPCMVQILDLHAERRIATIH